MIMKRAMAIFPLIIGLIAAAPVSLSQAAQPSASTISGRIAETQVSLEVGALQARATVIGKTRSSLVVETAAHALSAHDVGRQVTVGPRGRCLVGRIAYVTRNPNFQPIMHGDSDGPSIDGAVGVDSAVAVIDVRLRDSAARRAFDAFRAAEMATRLVPGSPSRVLWVHIVDQFGNDHVVRAGNHLNPRCLAWGGQGYEPRPGDSGSGVFVVVETADGRVKPILIGNVAQVDDRGGLATLAHRAPWIDRAIDGNGANSRPVYGAGRSQRSHEHR